MRTEKLTGGVEHYASRKMEKTPHGHRLLRRGSGQFGVRKWRWWYWLIISATLVDFALHFHIRAENNLGYAIKSTGFRKKSGAFCCLSNIERPQNKVGDESTIDRSWRAVYDLAEDVRWDRRRMLL